MDVVLATPNVGVVIVGLVKVLLLNVSVVARPTSVSVLDGNVNVPMFIIVSIIGLTNVLFVNVSVVARPIRVSVAFGRVYILLPVLAFIKNDKNVAAVLYIHSVHC